MHKEVQLAALVLAECLDIGDLVGIVEAARRSPPSLEKHGRQTACSITVKWPFSRFTGVSGYLIKIAITLQETRSASAGMRDRMSQKASAYSLS